MVYRPVLGLVLAGGDSKRMGEDKALLPFNNDTLLAHMQGIVAETSVDEVRVSRNGAPPIHYIQDLITGRGPLSGIHAAATQFPQHDLLVVPVDIPLIRAHSLNALLKAGQRHTKNARYKASTHAGTKPVKAHNLPIFLHNTLEFRQLLTSTLSNTESSSVYTFVSQFDLIEMPIDFENELTNINTLLDFEALQQTSMK